MSFKYINPGYAELLQIDSRYTGYAITEYTTSEQSRTGVAFRDYWNYNKDVVISDVPTAAGKELWASFDFFFRDSEDNSIYVGFFQDYIASYAKTALNLYLPSSTNTKSISLYRSSSASTKIVESSNLSDLFLRSDALNHIWIHFLFGDSSTGYVEFKVNTSYYGKYTGAATTPPVNYFAICSANARNRALFSSIIVSDEEISPNERVVLLPVSNTVTDMESLASGLYVADTASETLLQAVDTSALMQEYGSNTNITGIALVGNPAYQVDDVIGNITSITKQNNTITDHDKISLLTSTDAIISSCFTLSTDTTIADLAGMQFGWRSEE